MHKKVIKVSNSSLTGFYKCCTVETKLNTLMKVEQDSFNLNLKKLMDIKENVGSYSKHCSFKHEENSIPNNNEISKKRCCV